MEVTRSKFDWWVATKYLLTQSALNLGRRRYISFFGGVLLGVSIAAIVESLALYILDYSLRFDNTISVVCMRVAELRRLHNTIATTQTS